MRSGQGSLAGSISWRGEDFAAGRAAVAAQRVALLKVLKLAGFADSEVIFAATDFTRYEPAVFVEYAGQYEGTRAPIQRAPVDFNRFAHGKVPEYGFSQTFVLESPNVDRILAFSRQEIFLDDGVTLARNTPVFRLVKLNEAKKELLEAAAQDAQRRAATMVTGSGSRLVPCSRPPKASSRSAPRTASASRTVTASTFTPSTRPSGWWSRCASRL